MPIPAGPVFTPPSVVIVSALPTPEVLTAIAESSIQLSSRVEIYEADGLTRWSMDDGARLIDGSVTIDYSRDERRAFDLTLDNFDNLLVHDPDGFWYDKVLKIYKSVTFRASFNEYLYTDAIWETQIGEFMIDTLSEAHFPHQTKVNGRDYAKKCLNSKFVVATEFTSAQSIESLIQNIASNAGITKFILPVTGKAVNRTFTYERGVERWAAMKEISDSYGYELYFDAQGYLVMREYLDPFLSPLAFTLSTGQAGNLVSYEKSTNDSRVYNHIIVTGESADTNTLPVFAEAVNIEPSSPTRVSRIGDRVYQYTSGFLTTISQCQDTADKFLAIHALEEYDLNFSSISYPWVEVGEIVGFTDPRPGVNAPDRFLISALTIPLKLGPMSGNAKRVTVVG